MPNPNELRSLAAAKAAVDGHTQAMGLDTEDNPRLALWHLLYSLEGYAKANGVDFKEVSENARTERSIHETA